MGFCSRRVLQATSSEQIVLLVMNTLDCRVILGNAF